MSLFQESLWVLRPALSSLVVFGPNRSLRSLFTPFYASAKSRVQTLGTVMSRVPGCRRGSGLRQPCLQRQMGTLDEQAPGDRKRPHHPLSRGHPRRGHINSARMCARTHTPNRKGSTGSVELLVHFPELCYMCWQQTVNGVCVHFLCCSYFSELSSISSYYFPTTTMSSHYCLLMTGTNYSHFFT